jgi:hypothetical protein
MPRSLYIAVLIIVVTAVGFGIAVFRRSIGERVLATGEFHSVSHKGKGSVRIVESDGKLLLKIDEFRTYSRPGLIVLLIASADAFENESVQRSERFEVGELQREEGSMRYQLPPDLDRPKYNAVTIWNADYGVNYATAPLVWKKEKMQ